VGAPANGEPSVVITDADRDRLAILVHEVRSPVAALSAIAEAMHEEILESSARAELAGLALAACRGIERVVTDATVASVRIEPVDVARLVRETAAAAAIAGASVRAELVPGLPLLDADPLRLRQALDNLVSNALAHAPAGTEVLLSASPRRNDLLLAVMDSGGGIPLEDQARIFDAGVRLDVQRPGAGLGLAIARAIAESHGGTLTVESAPGEGATFTLTLPLAPRL
jgi:two-component system, OmpR family, sensor histidine kinase BaeS